jgi:hypothetical protein
MCSEEVYDQKGKFYLRWNNAVTWKFNRTFYRSRQGNVTWLWSNGALYRGRPCYVTKCGTARYVLEITCLRKNIFMLKNDKQPSEIWGSISGVHNNYVFRHVLPFQLINSYRLQSTEDEGARFLRNDGVCYVIRYTAPDRRITESSRRCISYTQK